LAMLAGPAVIWLIDWAGRGALRWKRVGLRVGLTAALAIALVGGTAAGLEAAYRFPGPFLFGSDARSVTPELLATSQWFSARFGTGNKIVTDRYTGLVFGSFGLQKLARPSDGFPVWDLYLTKPGISIDPLLLDDLALSRYAYLIVDARMAYDVPQLGVYFTPNDPSSVRPQGDQSPFSGRLDKFNTIVWAVKIFQSDDYAVYRLNLSATATPQSYQGQAPTSPGRHPKVLQGKLTVTP
jgi:hypothetical protein